MTLSFNCNCIPGLSTLSIDSVDERWFEPDSEAERRRLEQLRQKQLAAQENNFTSERLFGRRFSGAVCGVAEWREELQEAIFKGAPPVKAKDDTSLGDDAFVNLHGFCVFNHVISKQTSTC